MSCTRCTDAEDSPGNQGKIRSTLNVYSFEEAYNPMVAPIRSSEVHKPYPHNIQKPRRASDEAREKPNPRPLPPVQIKPSADVAPKPFPVSFDGARPAKHIKFDLTSDQTFYKVPKPVLEEKKGEGLFVGPPVRIDSEKKIDPKPLPWQEIKPICIKVPKPISDVNEDDELAKKIALNSPPVNDTKPHCIKVPKPTSNDKKDEWLFVGPPVKTDKKWLQAQAVDLYYPAADQASDICIKHSKMRDKKDLVEA